jgi:hypothetical protein
VARQFISPEGGARVRGPLFPFCPTEAAPSTYTQPANALGRSLLGKRKPTGPPGINRRAREAVSMLA